MPKSLFYTGVICSALLGVFAAGHAVTRFTPGRAPQLDLLILDYVAAGAAASSFFFVALLLIAIPAAALFVRMASLVAPRNLFSAFLALCLLACTILGLAMFTIGNLRFSVVASAEAAGVSVARESLIAMLEIRTLGYYSAGLFLALTLLAVRPYFKLYSNGAVSALVALPSVLYVWVIAEQLAAPAGAVSTVYLSAPGFMLFGLVSAIFFAVSVHCLRHRHLFMEATNLRQLLDPRFDPGTEGAPNGGRKRFGFGGGVAFDS